MYVQDFQKFSNRCVSNYETDERWNNTVFNGIVEYSWNEDSEVYLFHWLNQTSKILEPHNIKNCDDLFFD